MNYDTSPISIKKRKQRNKPTTSSVKMNDHTTDSCKSTCNKDSEETCSNASETPVRKNGPISDSPQFLDFAESPEFRVGWDDGFEPATSCDKIKMDETLNHSKKKSKRQVFVRTLRTQRILNCQPENVITETEHPDSDEFLQWAESLLCGPSDSEKQIESPININNSKLNQSSNTSNGIRSPKINDMKTPKRPVFRRSPSSESSKQGGIFRSSRKKSCTSTESDQKFTSTSFRNLQESPLVKFSNGTSTSEHFSNEKSISNKLKSHISTNNNVEAHKDEINDYFNDSINELMIQCSQAVESKINKENSDLKNLLDDSSNDLILQCTQQAEEKLLQENKNDDFSKKGGRSYYNNDAPKKSLEKNSNVKLKININNSGGCFNNKKSFVPKQASNLHKLDSPNTIVFDDEAVNNVISSINKQFLSKGYNNDRSSSPNVLRGDSKNHIMQGTNQKTSNKHFLSPTTKDDAIRRKKFCHNNNVITLKVNQEYNVSFCNNQDLNSILNEDEDLLSNLDIDQVLSQMPSIQPITKLKSIVPENKTCTQATFEEPHHEAVSANNISGPKQSTITFNGFKPNPTKSVFESRNNLINVQETTPPVSLPDVIPKYTQEQIQMKKIEAKRRQALKLRERQKSFELK